MISMKKLDEKEIIEKIQRGLDKKKFLSDDVERFEIDGKKFVTKVDTFVESTDKPQKMTMYQAVRKSIISCVSDFACKGVKPQYAIISMNLPRTLKQKDIQDITKSLKNSSKEFGIKILGGDMNEGREFVSHVCMFGKSQKNIKRNGAKNNDIIFATGPFGLTGVGMKVLLENKKGDRKFVQECVKSVLMPKSRLKFGINVNKFITSSMDSSDGLSTTLNEMATQSKKKFLIEKIPTKKGVYDFARLNKIDSFNLIFDAGEEFEFIFTANKRFEKKILSLAKKSRIPIIRIGYVISGKNVFLKDGKILKKIENFGWSHFK